MPASDLLSETKACDTLSRLFRDRGYQVLRNVQFHEYGVSFHIDGWDPKARVGFEFLTSEDEDHDDLTLREYQTLMAAQQRGELSLFVVDEVEPLSGTELASMAGEFLDEVAAAAAARRTGRAPGRAKTPAKQAAGKASAKKPVKQAKKAAGKPTQKTVSKPAAKKPAAKKPAAKKPAAKKPAAKSRSR